MMTITQHDLRELAYELACCRPERNGSPSVLGLAVYGEAAYEVAYGAWRSARDHVANACAKTNPRFNRDLFDQATEAHRLSTKYHGR